MQALNWQLPTRALYTKSQIEAIKKELDDLKQQPDLDLTPKEAARINRHRCLLEVSVHPDTGKVIFWPFRMSSFYFMAMPIGYGLILSPPTFFNTVLWQTVN